MKKRSAILLAILLALSCKAERSADMPGKPPAPVMPELAKPASAQLARNAVTTEADASSAPAAAPAAPAMPRMVVRNAQITLVVTDAAASVDKLTALAAAAGGYVSESKGWRDNDQLRGTLTLRIPAARLDATLAAARKLAVRVDGESLGSDDVTQEYVDLESQVRNLEAAEVEMRQLMTTVRQKMEKAEDILEVYAHLTELRGQIEQAKGRMRYLSQMSALATLRIDLVPDAIAKPVVTPGWQPLAIAREASRTLVRTLQAIASVAIWCAIYLLPVALLFVLAVLLLRVIARRLKITAPRDAAPPAV